MLEKANKLNHLAVIMDGNRRWAKHNNLNIKDGHRAGAEKLSEFVKWCIDFNIKYLTVYAFSTENWKRDENEVNDIMALLKDKFKKDGVKIKVIGVDDGVEKSIINQINEIEKYTENNNKLQLNIAFNYGGRREIIDTTKKIIGQIKNNDISIEDVDEELFKKNLYYGDIPDPDLVIRTGNEYRLSNFLLWEIAYSELCITDVYWPDFSKELLNDIINNFNKRERRYGGTI